MLKVFHSCNSAGINTPCDRVSCSDGQLLLHLISVNEFIFNELADISNINKANI